MFNDASISTLPPQPNVLHDILGFCRTPEHALGDPEQTRTHFDKNRQTVAILNQICVGANGETALFCCHRDSQSIRCSSRGKWASSSGLMVRFLSTREFFCYFHSHLSQKLRQLGLREYNRQMRDLPLKVMGGNQ